MAVDPTVGPAYQIPADGVPVEQPLPDPGYADDMVRNPDGSDAGPLYLSPDAERWINQNVIDRGYRIDWGTREIYDPETGEVKGTVPAVFDRMI
jgi:hypothetical protein